MKNFCKLRTFSSMMLDIVALDILRMIKVWIRNRNRNIEIWHINNWLTLYINFYNKYYSSKLFHEFNNEIQDKYKHDNNNLNWFSNNWRKSRRNYRIQIVIMNDIFLVINYFLLYNLCLSYNKVFQFIKDRFCDIDVI